MDNKRKDSKLPYVEIAQTLDNGIVGADALRHEGLAGLAQIKRAKLVQTRRERGRLEAKYDADHPRVQQLDRQMVAEHRAMVFARMERDKTAIELPARDDKQFIMIGHVWDEDGYPLEAYQAGLYTKAAAKAEVAIEAVTDEHGFFQLNITVATGGPETGALTHAVEIPAVEPPLYLMVKNKTGKVVHKDNQPIKAVAGGLVHRDVVISVVSYPCCGNCQTRYLGNSGSRELHDLSNEKPRCSLAKMRPDHRVYFASPKEAEQADYDYCAYCFGKGKSKR
jgi:hypothetical protein